jgi:hypothetical protein
MRIGARRRGASRIGTVVFALLLVLLPTIESSAQDNAGKPRDLNTVLFGSLDGGRSVFVSAGVKRTLGGSLDRDGFVFMGGAGFGGAPERDAASGRTDFRPVAQGHAVLGYQWIFPRAAVSVLAGPEVDAEADSLSAARSARSRIGVRGHAEMWAHPTPATLATATLIAGSARGHVWSRISGGYAFWPGVFLGPEASFYARDDYREWRFGAHVTGLKWGPFNIRFSGGMLQSNDDRTGAYFGLSGYVRM